MSRPAMAGRDGDQAPAAHPRTRGRQSGDVKKPRGRHSQGLLVYLEEVRRVTPLAPGQERRLWGRIRRGDTGALDKMALTSLALVAEEVERQRARGADVLALVAEGNRALMNAILAYGAGGSGDFRGYARSHIRAAISGARAD